MDSTFHFTNKINKTIKNVTLTTLTIIHANFVDRYRAARFSDPIIQKKQFVREKNLLEVNN